MSWYLPVARNLGFVLRRFALIVASLVPVSVAWGEYYAIPGELLAAAVVYGIGRALQRWGSEAEESSAAQALASAAIVWLVVGLLSSLPFVLVVVTIALDPGGVTVPSLNRTLRPFLSPDNAVFEAFSGITGTGLTVTRNPSQLPATLQWWRSLLEWLGGIGIVVLVVGIVRQGDQSVLHQYYEERSPLGRAGEDLPSPSVMLGVFAAFTVFAVLLLWLAGMPAWHAINHGMTGLSTGGFAVTDSSIAAYDSLAVRLALLPVMFVGAIPLPVYYLLLKGNPSGFARDLQTRRLFPAIVAGAALIAAILFASGTYRPTVERAVVAAFQFTSAITCTGFTVSTQMTVRWPTLALLPVTVAMVVGGSEGSTASGVKVVRVSSIAAGIRERIREPFPGTDPSREIEISGEHVSANYYNATIILSLWLLFLLLGVFALLATLPSGTSLESALFEVASAQGNVGLSSGISSPSLPAWSKAVLVFNMWVGRLTVIPVLILLFTPLSSG